MRLLKKYYVQPVDLSTMEVEAEKIEVKENGVVFFVDNRIVFYSPNHNTKYISEKDYSIVKKRN